jgi:lipopolysaccharide/colanic/teichoic acid biosynthesis glycosyltransferase
LRFGQGWCILYDGAFYAHRADGCLAHSFYMKIPAPNSVSRIGQQNKLFLMPKFQTVRVDNPTVAIHVIFNSKVQLTPVGSTV